MICLPLMSWQGFSCSFATLLIVMEGLRYSSTPKSALVHHFLHMKVNNWICYDEALVVRHQLCSRFCTFVHVLLSQLSCHLVTSEMYLLSFLYFSYMNSSMWMLQYSFSVQLEPKYLPENYENSSLTSQYKSTSCSAKSQWGVILTLRNYLAKSGDVFDCCNCGGRDCY